MPNWKDALKHGLLIFAATLGLALWGAVISATRGGYVPSEPITVPYFLTLFFLGTLFMLAALKVTKRGTVFEVLFAIAMLSGAWFIADIFIPGPWALILGSCVILARYRWKRVIVVNLSMAIGIAGIAASVAPSITPNAVVIVFTVLAFYDIVAVYATHHMVRMFRDLTSRGTLLAFLLTPLRKKELFQPVSQAISEGKTLYLGTGDVALPAMLAASAARVSPLHGVAAAIGAMAGFALMVLLFVRQPRRKPMPALPPIAVGSILFYLISLILLPA